MQRHALGILAIVLLAVGALTYDGASAALGGTCLRIGMLLALGWLAYPQWRAIPLWMVGVLAAGTLVVLTRPKLIVIVLPVILALWLLRPRGARVRDRAGDESR